MNSYNKHFLDLKYNRIDHYNNLLEYRNITNNLKEKFNYNDWNLENYYNHISNMYLLIEKFIENNVFDIRNYLEEIILVNWSMLSDNKTKIERIIEILFDIYDKKNWKYGNTDEFRIMYYSPYANMLMLAQKIKRIKSQIKNEINLGKEESFFDSIYDLTNYCMIYLIWLKKGMPKLRNMKVIRSNLTQALKPYLNKLIDESLTKEQLKIADREDILDKLEYLIKMEIDSQYSRWKDKIQEII